MNPWHCNLCDESVPAQDIVTGSHLRVMHPDIDEREPETWPDGELVFFDETVDEEFA